MAGLFTGFSPEYVKRYMDLGAGLSEAARLYANEVRSGAFPADEHCFGVKKKERR